MHTQVTIITDRMRILQLSIRRIITHVAYSDIVWLNYLNQCTVILYTVAMGGAQPLQVPPVRSGKISLNADNIFDMLLKLMCFRELWLWIFSTDPRLMPVTCMIYLLPLIVSALPILKLIFCIVLPHLASLYLIQPSFTTFSLVLPHIASFNHIQPSFTSYILVYHILPQICRYFSHVSSVSSRHPKLSIKSPNIYINTLKLTCSI